MAPSLCLLLITYFVNSIDAECRAILANGTPWISLDVCFSRYEHMSHRSITVSCTKSGTAVLVKLYNGADCEDPMINKSIQEYDKSQLQCTGNICNHAIIRNYDETNCDRSGAYTEFPFPVKQCFTLPTMEKHFGSVKFSCNKTGVFTQMYPANSKNCNDKFAKELVAWDEYGKCNNDYQWSQFIKCSNSNPDKSCSCLIFIVLILTNFVY